MSCKDRRAKIPFLLSYWIRSTRVANHSAIPFRPLPLSFVLFGICCFSAISVAQQGPLHLGAVGGFTPGDVTGFIGDRSQGLWSVMNAGDESPLGSRSDSVSKLDLKAPGKARSDYEKGYEALMRKDFTKAIAQLTDATSIYPQYVAAYTALGNTYLGLGQTQQARDQFAKAVSLDDHLPILHLNLGCAELTLGNFPAAEVSIQKASAIAPLDQQLLTALAYAQYMNKDYSGTITTANQVHSAKHKNASLVHYFAAAAWESQNKLPEAQKELEILLKEDPKSPAADQARAILQQLKIEQSRPARPKTVSLTTTVGEDVPKVDAKVALAQAQERIQKLKQDSREQQQIAEAEAVCESCSAAEPSEMAKVEVPSVGTSPRLSIDKSSTGYVMRSSVDEVAVFFAATDHGKAVSDLKRQDVELRDDHKVPSVITGFRNEDQLPLRMGILIDTSESVTSRFTFEQRAAAKFVQRVLTNKDDSAFVVGFANSILLVQDFTNDQSAIAQAINQLAPGGGTAAWDAVSFATDKLSNRAEEHPVAKILVILSDGDENSSHTTLKEVIEKAESAGVIVYAVSTHQNSIQDDDLIGEQALKVLSERTGGALFAPGSLGFLNRSLDQLQEVIRSRYLISYKPAEFKRDDKYHTIEIKAEKSGSKLKVYARKGYVAHGEQVAEN